MLGLDWPESPCGTSGFKGGPEEFSGGEVAEMKFDWRLITGVFVGIVLGLHYSPILTVYFPVLMVIALILVLHAIHH